MFPKCVVITIVFIGINHIVITLLNTWSKEKDALASRAKKLLLLKSLLSWVTYNEL